MIFLGIDPGKSGAIAAVDGVGMVVGTVRLSETPADIYRWLSRMVLLFPPFGLIEKVHSMPKQGVSSTFKFGYSAGMCEGLLVAAGVPHEFITPAKWQGQMQCRTKGDKNVTKRAAQRLWPDEKIIHATADALLLAECARRTYNQRKGDK